MIRIYLRSCPRCTTGAVEFEERPLPGDMVCIACAWRPAPGQVLPLAHADAEGNRTPYEHCSKKRTCQRCPQPDCAIVLGERNARVDHEGRIARAISSQQLSGQGVSMDVQARLLGISRRQLNRDRALLRSMHHE